MNDREKWAFLQRAPHDDATHPEIRRRAAALWEASGRDRLVYAKLALALARDGIRYVRDTARVGGEDIAGFTREPSPTDAIDALERLADDCDAKARLFCALCLACPQQIPARMWPLWMGPPGEHLAHVAAECWLGGAWLHAEPTLARARLGEHHNQVPKEPNGKWKT